MAEPKVARDAEERGEGICRTCLAPIWNEGGTIGRRKRETGWSDRIERGGDSLVCFRAIEYRHVPLTGREAEIYDVALARGTGMDGEAFERWRAAALVAEQGDRRNERNCRSCGEGREHSKRCHSDEHESCDRIAEGRKTPRSCECHCHATIREKWSTR